MIPHRSRDAPCHLYFERFGKERPDVVQSIEEKLRLDEEKKERRREATRMARLVIDTDDSGERSADE